MVMLTYSLSPQRVEVRSSRDQGHPSWLHLEPETKTKSHKQRELGAGLERTLEG